MLKEWNQGRGNRHDLLGRYVHILDLIRGRQGKFILMTAGNQIVNQLAFAIDSSVSLGDDILTLVNGGQVFDFISQLTVNNLAIRCFQEAIAIGAGIDRQRVDQTNVRTFWRFNRTHTTVMGWVHVAHFEAGALAGQTTGA